MKTYHVKLKMIQQHELPCCEVSTRDFRIICQTTLVCKMSNRFVVSIKRKGILKVSGILYRDDRKGIVDETSKSRDMDEIEL